MWRLWWFALGVAVVPLVKGCCLVYRHRQRDRVLPSIGRPRYTFTGFDPGLRERTAKRRGVADQTKRRAHAIESGTQTQDLLRRA